uniref:Pentatricopeptide repeat-containing protein n=1 Tax=Kalanchoe fedtschenkoi TaxID=63787 RepID=A0A7N0UJY9_KALFE
MSLYMPLFKSCTSLRALRQLHAHLLTFGHCHSAQASTKLIESYSQMGTPESAQLVFKTFHRPDGFMWGVLMKCFVWSGLFRAAILQYRDMLYHDVETTSFIYPSVLRACAGFSDVRVGEVVHGRVVKLGFGGDDVVDTSLMSMYGELGSLSNACKMFDEMPEPDVVAWASIISSYVRDGNVSDGLWKFRQMMDAGVSADSVTMLSVAEACGEVGCPRLARSVHGHVLTTGNTNELLDNSLAVMYGKCGDLSGAEILFSRIREPRSVSSWSAMISCYNQAGCFEQALEVFTRMLRAHSEPNSVTMASVLGSCIGLGCLKEGKSVHCFVLKKDFELDYLGPSMIEFYTHHGKIRDSVEVFDTVPEKTMILWNMLISAHVKKGLLTEASEFLAQMRKHGLLPDAFALSSVLSACADMGCAELGCQIHGHSIKTGSHDEFVVNALIDMYSKCGSTDSAYLIFDSFQHKSVVTWNSMITGFSQIGNSARAIDLFDQMYTGSLEMNYVTFLTVIQACANSGYIDKGKWVHHELITYGVSIDTFIATALTDMYGKCGDLRMSRRVFDSMADKSVVSWSAMISCYGMHGQINNAILIFDKMIESGVKPNQVTFMNILSACSHAGCVEQGSRFFHMMEVFGVVPNSEHLACVVDLLSRAGDLKGAYEVIKSAKFPVDASTWGALLNGCRIHGRMDLITDMKESFLDVETDDTGYYTLLSNVYAEDGNWNDFSKVRSRMRTTGLTKVPAYSSIETQ